MPMPGNVRHVAAAAVFILAASPRDSSRSSPLSCYDFSGYRSMTARSRGIGNQRDLTASRRKTTGFIVASRPRLCVIGN